MLNNAEKQCMKEIGFEKEEDFFDYIIESRINGQHKQAKKLFFSLDDGMQGGRVYFFSYLNEISADCNEWKSYLFERD